jgi:diguanylate cyclase (GGDEF)-like protein/PAS domain S-box-containing protein
MVLIDHTGNCLKINAAFAVQFNLPVEAVVDRPITTVLEWVDWQSIWQEVVQLHTSQEITWLDGAGRMMTEKITLIPVERDQMVVAVYLIIQDISESKLMEERYRAKSEILDWIEANSSDFIAVVDDQEIIRYASPSYTTIFGRALTEIVNRHALEYVHPDDVPFLRQRLVESLSGEIYWLPIEFRFSHIDGRWIYVDVRATPVKTQNGKSQITLFLRDISKRKQQAEQINHMAYYDTLTDLPNRHFLRERLEQALNHQPDRLGFLFIDLDGFKKVNDTQGHTAGDILLQQVAQRLMNVLPKNGFLARMGGDEFVILLDELQSVADVQQFAQIMLSVIAEPFLIYDQTVQLTTSIGISLYPEHGHSAEELIRTADVALYQAKNKGKNSYSMYIAPM